MVCFDGFPVDENEEERVISLCTFIRNEISFVFCNSLIPKNRTISPVFQGQSSSNIMLDYFFDISVLCNRKVFIQIDLENKSIDWYSSSLEQLQNLHPIIWMVKSNFRLLVNNLLEQWYTDWPLKCWRLFIVWIKKMNDISRVNTSSNNHQYFSSPASFYWLPMVDVRILSFAKRLTSMYEWQFPHLCNSVSFSEEQKWNNSSIFFWFVWFYRQWLSIVSKRTMISKKVNNSIFESLSLSLSKFSVRSLRSLVFLLRILSIVLYVSVCMYM